jgi:hypothetical protein
MIAYRCKTSYSQTSLDWTRIRTKFVSLWIYGTEYEPSEWVGEFQRMIQYASYSVDQLIFGNSASGCDQISLRQVSNVINDMLYLFTFSQWYALYIDLFPMICSSYWPMPNIDCTCIFLHNVISCLRQYITSVTISKCETTFDWIIYLEMVAL